MENAITYAKSIFVETWFFFFFHKFKRGTKIIVYSVNRMRVRKNARYACGISKNKKGLTTRPEK